MQLIHYRGRCGRRRLLHHCWHFIVSISLKRLYTHENVPPLPAFFEVSKPVANLQEFLLTVLSAALSLSLSRFAFVFNSLRCPISLAAPPASHCYLRVDWKVPDAQVERIFFSSSYCNSSNTECAIFLLLLPLLLAALFSFFFFSLPSRFICIPCIYFTRQLFVSLFLCPFHWRLYFLGVVDTTFFAQRELDQHKFTLYRGLRPH